MKPPSAEVTREALDWFSGDLLTEIPKADEVYGQVRLDAAEAWSRIAPDADGELDEKVYEVAVNVFRQAGYRNKGIRILLDQAVDAALAELARLAEGSDG